MSRADNPRDTSRVTARLSPHCRESHAAGSAARRVSTDSARALAARNRHARATATATYTHTRLTPPPLSVAPPTVARAAPSTTAPASATSAAASRPSVAFAAAVDELSSARRSLRRAQRHEFAQGHHAALNGHSGDTSASGLAREETPHAALADGIGPGGTFSGASVFVVCRHGALLGRAGNFWQDFGGRRRNRRNAARNRVQRNARRDRPHGRPRRPRAEPAHLGGSRRLPTRGLRGHDDGGQPRSPRLGLEHGRHA